jgi:hypothetical protein
LGEEAGLEAGARTVDEDFPAIGEGDLAVGALGLEETGEFGVEAAGAQGLEGVGELLLGVGAEAGEFVVGEQVGEFVGIGGVVLVANGDGRPAGEHGRFGDTVAADDETGAAGHGDGPAPTIGGDDLHGQGELAVGVALRILRVRLERRRRHQVLGDAVDRGRLQIL